MSGSHTYTKSVQINGTVKIKQYDGSDENSGKLVLQAPWIIIGPGGAIVGDGRGYGGGGGGSTYYSGLAGGLAGTGGKGGNGANGYSGYYCGGGGGGSTGGTGGNPGPYGYFAAGTGGTDAKGGDGGGDSSSCPGGTGGKGFGGGGGGGGDWYYGGGGGGGGGSGGKDASSNTGGAGGGTFGGSGGTSTSYGPGQTGSIGGYMTAKGNGDTSTDMSVVRGSGGGGGGGCSYQAGGGGGGGAGGASVALISTGDLTVSGPVTTTGSPGGGGGSYYGTIGGRGEGGAGGGILLSGLKVTVDGVLDARGRNGDALSTTNGGSIKVYFETDVFTTTNFQGGRVYTNGRPKMQGVIAPLEGGSALPKASFSWKDAKDPENDQISYEIQVATTPDFATPAIDEEGLTTTTYTSQIDLIGSFFYWRVRAKDMVAYGGWSEKVKFFTDITPPVTRVTTLPQYTNDTNFTVSWSGTDDASGISKYTIWASEGNGTFRPWVENTTNKSAVYHGRDGVKFSFFSTSIDKAFNQEEQKEKPDTCTTVDTTPPISGLVGLSAGQSTAKFQVTWSGKDATSGIKFYNVYAADGNDPFDLWQEQTAKNTAQFEGESGHEYSFYTIAVDKALNYEETPGPDKIARTKVDMLPPVTTVRLGQPNYGQEPTFVTTNTQIFLDGVDDFSGINASFYQIDSREVKQFNYSIRESNFGPHNMTYWSVDKAGNREFASRFSFLVDGDVPVTYIRFDGPNSTGENKFFLSGTTTIALEAIDGSSGVNYSEYNLDNRGYKRYVEPLKFTAAGTHTLAYRSVDMVGNVEPEKTMRITVDTQSPTTKASSTATMSRETLVVVLSATDDNSGLAGTFFRVQREKKKAGDFQQGTEVTIEAAEDHSLDGNYTVQFYSVDNVSNTERVREYKVKIDTQATFQLGFTGELSVDENRYLLDGTTEPGSKVTVNKEDVLVTAGGTFTNELQLNPGQNRVTIVITDPAGNSLSKTVYITYNEPATEAAWFVPLVLIIIVVVVAAVGAVAFMLMKKKKAAPAASPPKAWYPPPVQPAR